MRSTAAFLIATVGVALVIAGCGEDDDEYGAPAKQPGAGTTQAGGAATVAARDTDLGQVVADGQGMTLYIFAKDEGGQSSCSGECASRWPPLLTKGEPQAGSGGDASLLGTVKRNDGTTQVTYRGQPLYYYVEDTQPGDTNGNAVEEFGAVWYALTPAGEEAGEGAGSGGYDY